MTAPLPDPLVPAEVDLRDFQFMPLDVRRLRDSRLVSTRSPEEVVAAILLWSSSWHQSPAASLPDDDVELSALAGYGGIRGVELFRAIKAGALYGFVRCRDGRWYHPVVAEKALAAWQAKVETAHRKDKDRYRKLHNTAEGFPTVDVWNETRLSSGSTIDFRWNKPPIPKESTVDSDGKPPASQGSSAGIPPDLPPKGEGEGEGEGQGDIEELKTLTTTTRQSRRGVDPIKDEIWDKGLPLLLTEGKSRDTAASLLGKLVKEYGQQLAVRAVRDALLAAPLKPSEWLVAYCQERRSNGGTHGTHREGGRPPTAAERNAATIAGLTGTGNGSLPLTLDGTAERVD